MSKNFFKSLQFFFLILVKIGTHDLCANMEKIVEQIFKIWNFKIFGKFFKFWIWT